MFDSIFLIHPPISHITLLTSLLSGRVHSFDFKMPIRVTCCCVYAWCYQFDLVNMLVRLEAQFAHFDNSFFQAAYDLSSPFFLVSLTKQSMAAWRLYPGKQNKNIRWCQNITSATI